MMDPCEEIIPQRVDLEQKPSAYGETRQHSPRSIAAVVLKVLDDDDLLIEILLRVGFPTTLVRSAAVCRRWLQLASNGAFLHRFRELHPPRLLGFYIYTDPGMRLPRFIPMLPQPPELAAVIRQASSSFDTYKSDSSSTSILDCRNGHVLLDLEQDDGSKSTFGLHKLLCPQRGMTIIPPYPSTQRPGCKFYIYRAVLSKEEEGRLPYLTVVMQSTRDRKYKFHIYFFQDGVWCMHNKMYIDELLPLRSDPNAVLVGSKIYMPASQSDIVVLDLTTSSFSTVQLPQGVEYSERNIILSQADDAIGLYLIYVNQLQLRIWLHNGNDWLLMDTFYLREMCANLSLLDCNSLPQIIQVGDNAEFVFLEMGQSLLHLDIKCRTLFKVYEVTKDDPCLDDIYPFMMIWPPTFPALKDDPSRSAV